MLGPVLSLLLAAAGVPVAPPAPTFLGSLGPVKVQAPTAPAALDVTVSRHTMTWYTREKTDSRSVSGTLSLKLESGGAAHLEWKAREQGRFDVSHFASHSGKNERTDHDDSTADALPCTWAAAPGALTVTPSEGKWALRCVQLTGGALPGPVWACQATGEVPDGLMRLAVPAGAAGEPWLLLGAGLQVRSDSDSRREPELALRLSDKR
jgi:hypothetical protein